MRVWAEPETESRTKRFALIPLVLSLLINPLFVAERVNAQGQSPSSGARPDPAPRPPHSEPVSDERNEPREQQAENGRPRYPSPAQLSQGRLDDLHSATELNGPSSRYYALPGAGAHVVQMFTGQVNYQTADGDWAPIQPHFVAAASGFVNAGASFDAFLPARLSPATGVGFSVPEGDLTFSPVGGASSEGVLEEGAVLYPDVWRHADIRYRLESMGLKEDIVVASPQGSASYVFRVDAESVTLEASGRVIEISHQGEAVGQIGPFFATDSSENPWGTAGAVAYTLEQTPAGGYMLEMTVDRAWL